MTLLTEKVSLEDRISDEKPKSSIMSCLDYWNIIGKIT